MKIFISLIFALTTHLAQANSLTCESAMDLNRCQTKVNVACDSWEQKAAQVYCSIHGGVREGSCLRKEWAPGEFWAYTMISADCKNNFKMVAEPVLYLTSCPVN